MARLDSLGINEPRPIQKATIADALAGRDICGQAPTGSGKTLAFALPLVAKPSRRREAGAPTGLVLVPTRELAQQVLAVLTSLNTSCRATAIYGGVGYGPQRQALRRGVDVVVACPGRLEDLVTQGDVRLDRVELVVIDEADRMVDMGFVKPVRKLLDRTSSNRQVLLFSATMGREVEAIIRTYQHEPRRCRIEPDRADEDAVTHLFWRAERSDRVEITARLVARHGQAFVFCRTKHGADRVAKQLRIFGVEAAAIHGDRSQAQRERALASFSAGRTHALIATDVVARGIHVDDVPCVVHFDAPGDRDSYVHRSGRTGRAGNTGTVVSLVPADAMGEMRSLQRSLGLEPRLDEPFAGELHDGRQTPPRPKVERNPSEAGSVAVASRRHSGGAGPRTSSSAGQTRRARSGQPSLRGRRPATRRAR